MRPLEEPIVRRWIVGGIAVLGMAASAPAAAPTAPIAKADIATKTCTGGRKHAIIGGAEKCLQRGQFCAAAYGRQYLRYGFRCVGGRLR